MWVTPVIVVVLLVVLLCAISYVKAPPNTAYIITGFGKKKGGKVLIGESGFRIPFLQKLDSLDLRLMQVDIKTSSPVPTTEYINIYVDGVSNVKISSNAEILKKAAENFIGVKQVSIATVAQQVLEGNLREIIGQMKLSQLVQEREAFAQKVAESANKDMERMGLEIVNLTIQNFVDKEGIIVNLGMDNTVQIKKTASIARANGERDIAIAESQAKEEANKVRALTEAQIALQNKELSMKRLEYEKEIEAKKAESEAAFRIAEQEQRKVIEIANAEANLAKTQREVEIKKQMLDAEIKAKADADTYALEREIYVKKQAVINEAEAQKEKSNREAEAIRIRAEAEKFKAIQIAESEKAAGLAKAEVVEATGLAEAKAIEEKAKAQKLMEEAAKLDMLFKVLPEIVKNAALPLSNVDSMIMYGDGNSSKLVGDVMNVSSQVINGVKNATGIDISSLLNGIIDKKPKAE